MARFLFVAVCAALVACSLAQTASEIGCEGCIEGRCTVIRDGRAVRCTACEVGFTLTRLDDKISRVCLQDDGDDDDDDEKPGDCPAAVQGSFGCEEKCESDDDCESANKCCNTACGKTCVAPEGTTGGTSEGDQPTATPEPPVTPVEEDAASPQPETDTAAPDVDGAIPAEPPTMEDVSDAQAAADLPDTDGEEAIPVPDVESAVADATVQDTESPTVDAVIGSEPVSDMEDVTVLSLAPETEDSMAPMDEEDEVLLDLDAGM